MWTYRQFTVTQMYYALLDADTMTANCGGELPDNSIGRWRVKLGGKGRALAVASITCKLAGLAYVWDKYDDEITVVGSRTSYGFWNMRSFIPLKDAYQEAMECVDLWKSHFPSEHFLRIRAHRENFGAVRHAVSALDPTLRIWRDSVGRDDPEVALDMDAAAGRVGGALWPWEYFESGKNLEDCSCAWD